MMRFTRRAMLLGVLFDLVLVAVSLTGNDSPLRMPRGGTSAIEAIVLLVVYGLLVGWVSTMASLSHQTALQVGTSAGVFGGLLQIVHMAMENFGQRVGENAVVTIAFMFGGFLIWGVAGYWVTRSTGKIESGLVAGCWSAMVSVVMATTFGLVLMSANIPPPEYVATWSEFKRSGWGNAHAFAIANSLDATFGHLVAGPVIGTIAGVLGGGIACLGLRPAHRGDDGRATG